MAERDTHIRAKLAALIKQTGVEMSHLSKVVLGRNHAYVFQYLNHNTPRRLGDGDVCKLAEYFGVKPSELSQDAGLDTEEGLGAVSSHGDVEPLGGLDTELLRYAIVATRVNFERGGVSVSIADEAAIIAKTYEELLAARKAKV